MTILRLALIVGCLTCAIAPLTAPRAAVAATMEIAAVVNDDAVSERDLNKRLRLIMASSGLPNNKEIRDRLTPQVLDGLIGERIMLQEAAKLNIEVGQPEIEDGFAKIAAQNKMEPQQFQAVLRKNGIDITTMYDQIKAQVAWSKVVQAKIRPRIVISERDIDAARERMAAKIGETEYLLAEIFLPVADGKKEASVKNLANRMAREIKGGKASFFKLAQQFSQNAGASNGGDLGWLNETQLDPDLFAAVKKLGKNQVSSPIKTANGYHILYLRDSRQLSEDTIPSDKQIEYNLGMQRIEKMQHSYLMDLRASSFVDVRI